ncbi:hypothetical protein [Paenibacillus jiagnxiensis]|uniref:hypothetical protein n=1 Tax=Paenibacillus jiagnxiensis TaxID=3228926 RepID=UPI00339FCF47
MRKKGWLVAATVVILLMAAVPAQAASVPSTGETTVKTVSSLTPTVTSRLEEAVKKMAGSEAFSFDTVMDMGKTWIVEGELNDGSAVFQTEYNKVNSRVESTTLRYKIGSMDQVLPSELKKKVLRAIESFDKNKSLEFEAFWRVHSPYQNNEPKDYWVFWGAGDSSSSLYVDIADENRISIHAEYPLANVNAKLVTRAENAIRNTWGKSVAIAHASRHKDEADGGFYWLFEDANESSSVKIGAVTGRVLKVSTPQTDWKSDRDFAASFSVPKYTPEQAKKAAAVKAKRLFNMSLSGYTVEIDKNTYTFTRKGQAVLTAKINKKGVFYELSLSPSNGKLQ